MVSVVMEGVVVRNSFPPGAVPSTWGPEEELLEVGDSERVPKTTAAPVTWAGGIPRYQAAGSVSERGEGDVHTLYVYVCMHPVVSDSFCGPIDCGPSGSSVHGILQARILEWVAISSSGGSSLLRGRTCIYCISRQVLYHWCHPPRKTRLYVVNSMERGLPKHSSDLERKEHIHPGNFEGGSGS